MFFVGWVERSDTHHVKRHPCLLCQPLMARVVRMQFVTPNLAVNDGYRLLQAMFFVGWVERSDTHHVKRHPCLPCQPLMARVVRMQSVAPDFAVNDGYRCAPPILRGLREVIEEYLSKKFPGCYT